MADTNVNGGTQQATGKLKSVESLDQTNEMERGLSNRHVQFIAIGGTIGTGTDNGYHGEFPGWTRLTSSNAGTAKVTGWEFSYQQQSTLLPGLLKGFGASANYTLISTSGDFGGATSRSTNEVPGFIPRSGNATLSWR